MFGMGIVGERANCCAVLYYFMFYTRLCDFFINMFEIKFCIIWGEDKSLALQWGVAFNVCLL